MIGLSMQQTDDPSQHMLRIPNKFSMARCWSFIPALVHDVIMHVGWPAVTANIMTLSISNVVLFFTAFIFVEAGQSAKTVEICTHRKFPSIQYKMCLKMCTLGMIHIFRHILYLRCLVRISKRKQARKAEFWTHTDSHVLKRSSTLANDSKRDWRSKWAP